MTPRLPLLFTGLALIGTRLLELLGCDVFTVTSELAAFVALAGWLTALLTLPTETALPAEVTAGAFT